MQTFFFGEQNMLYGALTAPQGPARAAVVFCPPFGEEFTCTYARFARWSKELARRNVAVLRFHPRGMGDTAAPFSDFTLNSARKDCTTALDWLRRNVPAERYGLFGLRFGASLAVLANSQPVADFMVLWSPIVDLRQYFRELLRLRITKEMVHQKADRVRLSTGDMISELEEGRSIDLLGYDLSPALYAQMWACTGWPESPPAAAVLWLGRYAEQARAQAAMTPWQRMGSRAEIRLSNEPVFWEDFSSSFPEQFATASLRWLTDEVGRGKGAA